MKMGELAWFGLPDQKLKKYSGPGSITPGAIEALRRHMPSNRDGQLLIASIQKNDHHAIGVLLNHRPRLINRPIYYRMNVWSIDNLHVWRTPLEAAVCERSDVETIMLLVEHGAEINDTVFDMCARYDTNETPQAEDQGDLLRACLKRHLLGLIVPEQQPSLREKPKF